MLGVLVPEVERAVRPGGGKCAVDGVERNVVDGVDVGHVALVLRRLSVAFEGEIVGRVFLVDVLNRATALDGAHCKARRVGETADYSRLVFEGGLDRLVDLGWFVKVDDIDVSIRCAGDK